MRKVMVFMLAAAAAGCAVNPYSEHFTRIELAHAPALQPLKGEPRVVQGANEAQDRVRLLEAGYVPLGYSSFSAEVLKKGDAVSQAKAVGASLVLVYTQGPRHAGTPASYTATFWGVGRPSTFGVFVRALEPAERANSGRTGGFLVIAVRHGSPADRAGLRAGDVIDRIGDVTLRSSADMKTAMDRYAGRSAEVDILRGGKSLAKPVTFGALN